MNIFQNEVTLVVSEVKNTLPGVKSESGEENFLNKYEVAIIELILQGKDLSEVNYRRMCFITYKT